MNIVVEKDYMETIMCRRYHDIWGVGKDIDELSGA